MQPNEQKQTTINTNEPKQVSKKRAWVVVLAAVLLTLIITASAFGAYLSYYSSLKDREVRELSNTIDDLKKDENNGDVGVSPTASVTTTPDTSVTPTTSTNIKTYKNTEGIKYSFNYYQDLNTVEQNELTSDEKSSLVDAYRIDSSNEVEASYVSVDVYRTKDFIKNADVDLSKVSAANFDREFILAYQDIGSCKKDLSASDLKTKVVSNTSLIYAEVQGDCSKDIKSNLSVAQPKDGLFTQYLAARKINNEYFVIVQGIWFRSSHQQINNSVELIASSIKLD
jgi:hypothetical protein